MKSTQPDLDAPSLLDPSDWKAFREQAHRALDTALDFVEQRPQGSVWQEIPDTSKAVDAPLPIAGDSLDKLVAEVEEQIMPYTLGNNHPRFWGWVNGTGTPSGVVAQLMIGALNANMGGRDHAPIYLERQVIRWMHELFGYPEQASGIMCTGTSQATLLGLAVARQRCVGIEVRREGNALAPKLVAYASAQAHVSVDKAMELLGLGTESLCSIAVTDDYALDPADLSRSIERDLALGKRPFAVISCIGSVNSGAVDDLVAINEICHRHGIWHHVDGAFGALSILAPELRGHLAGIADADSIAFDFHKWMHVGYAAGCLLVRDGDLHRATFETRHAYLQGEHQGMAGGAPWPNDFGIDLSRGFNALAVWFQLRELGTARLGAAIYRNCLQAAWLGEAISRIPALELMAPVVLNIVCFRYHPEGWSLPRLNAFNRRLVIELQCRGLAAPSFTELGQSVVIRVSITNHRTRQRDLNALLDAVREIGAELASGTESGDGADNAGDFHNLSSEIGRP